MGELSAVDPAACPGSSLSPIGIPQSHLELRSHTQVGCSESPARPYLCLSPEPEQSSVARSTRVTKGWGSSTKENWGVSWGLGNPVDILHPSPREVLASEWVIRMNTPSLSCLGKALSATCLIQLVLEGPLPES